MNTGQLLLAVQDIIGLLVTNGFLHTDGTFDKTKLDTIQEDVAFVAAIEQVLKARGLPVPDKLDKVIALLPLIAQFV